MNIIRNEREKATPLCMDMAELFEQYRTQEEPVIEGLLRRGEVANLIGKPKTRKSFIALQLGWSVASGTDWLGFPILGGKHGCCLLVDTELRPSVLAARSRTVAEAMGALDKVNRFEVLSLRGHAWSVYDLTRYCEEKSNDSIDLLIVDSLYRLLPQGVSENDNGQMTEVYSELIQCAERLKCAVLVVHHATKGDQANRDNIDIGSGAGAIARSVDSHISLRAHTEDNHLVVSADLRSFAPIKDFTIRCEQPLWSRACESPIVRQQQTRQAGKQLKLNAEADQSILELLRQQGPLTESQARTRSGMGATRTARAISRLVTNGKLSTQQVGKQIRYQVPECTGVCTSICTNI